MTSSNGNIFRITGHVCREFTSPDEFPAQRPVTWTFDDFFDLHLIRRLSKQWWGWWFETLSRPLWRHCNVWRICKTVTYELNIWWGLLYILRLNVAHFADDIYKCNFLKENCCILIKVSLKFVPKGPIDYKIGHYLYRLGKWLGANQTICQYLSLWWSSHWKQRSSIW